MFLCFMSFWISAPGARIEGIGGGAQVQAGVDSQASIAEGLAQIEESCTAKKIVSHVFVLYVFLDFSSWCAY
jgi:hypothetical protein